MCLGHYLNERTSGTLLTMPFSNKVGNITATVLWAAEPVDSHIRVHTWTDRNRQFDIHIHIIHTGQWRGKQLYLTKCLQS